MGILGPPWLINNCLFQAVPSLTWMNGEQKEHVLSSGPDAVGSGRGQKVQ